MIFLYMLLSWFILINAYDREPHRNEKLVERFKFGDYYFIFYSKDANWAEAYTICQATHSRLAVINTPERAKFLAESLAQTKVGFEDMWIGGRFSKDSWQWPATGKIIPAPVKGFPPWLRYPTKRGKNCLSLDRRNHWYPIFVELKCHLYRPFICEESVSGSIDKFPDQGNEITVNNRRYILYYGRVTWQEALAFCKQSEAQIATIPDLDTATKLVEIMKRNRPAFENVWIGAKRDYLDWVWVPIDEPLANETQKNGFPPWRFDHPVDPMKSCVMLDHHVCLNPYHIRTFRQHICEEPVFMEENCGLKRDFLCEIPVDEEHLVVKPNLITIDQITYIFYEEPLSWIDAMYTCEKINMTLATPETDRHWQTLVNHMGDMQHALYHVWLGGRWIPNEWVWLNNNSISLPYPNNTNQPWCISMELHEEDQDCINLDRDAHNVPLIYGFNCSVKQPFVCQLDAIDFINSHDASTDNQEYQYHPEGKSHFEAEWECKTNRSHLAIVNNINIAQTIALLIPRNTLVWIGGRRIDSVWRWLKTREVIPDTRDDENYPPWESPNLAFGEAMCLAIKSGYREQPFFVERPCKEKLNYVCQFDKKDLPQPDVVVDVQPITYYFYKKGVPWSEAMTICHSGGLFLVSVGNLEQASFLTDVMADSIPIWTSGKQLTAGSWSWVTSGSKLPNTVKLGYPPWSNKTEPHDLSRACLQLDKVDGIPTFSGEECLTNLSFVCGDKSIIYNETEIEMNNLNVSLQDVITTIIKAKKACTDQGKTVVDFTKLDNETLLELLQAEKVKSLWIDVVRNNDGKWVYADTDEEFHTQINFPEKDTTSTNDPESCLTLSVTPEEILILLPALCSDFSRIICMTVNKTDPVPSRVEHVVNETTTIIAILENATVSESILTCNDLGGEMIQGPLVETAIAFFKTLHLEYRTFWFGAIYENNTWKWKDGNNVTLAGLPDESTYSNKTNYNEKICLIYDRTVDALAAESCSEKLGIVCQRVIGGVCEPKIMGKKSVKWPEKCTNESVTSGTVCRATCALSNTNLVGPEFHVCSMGKWSQTTEVKCQTNKNHGVALDDLTENKIRFELTQSSFLFLLDTGISKKDFVTTVQFARNLANTILLSNLRRVTLQLYSFRSKILDLLENNNCYLIHTVDRLIKTPHVLTNSFPNYGDAFLTAEQEFTDKDVKNGTGFIFFFAMRPDTGSMNRTLVVNRLKQEGVTFIVISVGDDINRSQLEEIASTRYGTLQLYTFQTIKGMKDASDFLKSRPKFRIRDCPRDANALG